MNLLTITNEVLKIKNVSIKCVRILDIVPLATENAIQIGILNRVILNYVADPDEHLPLRLREFREASVEDLRNGYKPLSFGDLVKKDEE